MRQIILLADDSPTIQRLVIQTFEDTRFDVVSIGNGDEAIQRLDEIRPAVVLADIYLSGKDGFEICRHVQAHPSLSNTPVILFVGAMDVFDQGAASLTGAAASITKPFEPHVLIEVVESVMREAAKRAEHSSDSSGEVQAADTVENTGKAIDTEDLLGLESLFQPEVVVVPEKLPPPLHEEEIERIAARVIDKLSTHIIESVAWDVVPDIAFKILRDELKRTVHEG